MRKLAVRYRWPLLVCVVSLPVLSNSIHAQSLLPTDVGTTVNGYQDDFDGGSLASLWQVRGANVTPVAVLIIDGADVRLESLGH